MFNLNTPIILFKRATIISEEFSKALTDILYSQNGPILVHLVKWCVNSLPIYWYCSSFQLKRICLERDLERDSRQLEMVASVWNVLFYSFEHGDFDWRDRRGQKGITWFVKKCTSRDFVLLLLLSFWWSAYIFTSPQPKKLYLQSPLKENSDPSNVL